MSRFRIQRYSANSTVPIGDDTITHTTSGQVNGILKGIVVTPPASLTGSSYGVKILDHNGATMFSKATLAANATALPIFTDANNEYINIPISNNAEGLVKIDVAGDSFATTTLTGTNAGNATDGKIVTIGAVTYRLKNTMAQINDVKIGADADTTLGNLVAAINHAAGEGTKYFTGTVAHPYVAAAAVTSHATVITATSKSAAVNALATTTDEATYSFTGSTLVDGGEAAARAFTVDLYIERG